MRAQVQKHRHSPYCALCTVTKPGPFHLFVLPPTLHSSLWVAWKDAGANREIPRVVDRQGLVLPVTAAGEQGVAVLSPGAVGAQWLHVDRRSTSLLPTLEGPFVGLVMNPAQIFFYQDCSACVLRVIQER